MSHLSCARCFGSLFVAGEKLVLPCQNTRCEYHVALLPPIETAKMDLTADFPIDPALNADEQPSGNVQAAGAESDFAVDMDADFTFDPAFDPSLYAEELPNAGNEMVNNDYNFAEPMEPLAPQLSDFPSPDWNIEYPPLNLGDAEATIVAANPMPYSPSAVSSRSTRSTRASTRLAGRRNITNTTTTLISSAALRSAAMKLTRLEKAADKINGTVRGDTIPLAELTPEKMPYVKQLSDSLYKIHRPSNSWMLYKTDKSRERKAAQKANSSAKTPFTSHAENISAFTSFSKSISAMWKSESAAVKEQYAQRAEILREEHLVLFPNYVFNPGQVARFSKK